MTLQELLNKEELLGTKFRQMILIEHHVHKLEYMKRKNMELNELIVNDSNYFRSLEINLSKIKLYKQRLLKEGMNVATHILDPSLDAELRLYNHLYRQEFLKTKNNPTEEQYIFLFNYRWLEMYFSILKDLTKHPLMMDTFYTLIYNMLFRL